MNDNAAPLGPVEALIKMIASHSGLVGVAFLDTVLTPASPIFATSPFAAFWQENASLLKSVDWTSGMNEWSAAHDRSDLTVPGVLRLVAVPVHVDQQQVGLILAIATKDPGPCPDAIRGLREGAKLLGLLIGIRTSGLPGSGIQYRILPRAGAQAMIGEDATHTASGKTRAILLLDIDRFSAVNAALGAAAGDSLLAITATRLARSIGPGESMARLEADRFLILSDRKSDELSSLATKLLGNVSEPIPIAGEKITLHGTVGIVAPTGSDAGAETLLMRAESALRRGKTAGGNRAVLHEPRAEALLRDRSRLEVDLGQAIELDQMRLVYQPYVDLETGKATGVEALLRWDHPQRGELQPAVFIGIAERTGKILSIGDWTLGRALEQASRWPDGPRLSVNISALQFRQHDFTRKVDAALAATGFPAERLELEITETVLMRDDPETIGQLRTLIRRGVRIALDDFGTGYSALSYLARLPHHRIKLDRSFVQDLRNPCTADLLQAIVSSARAQGVTVTAEGVETAAQLEEVRRMGFTHAQGFATGEPVSDPSFLWNMGQHQPA